MFVVMVSVFYNDPGKSVTFSLIWTHSFANEWMFMLNVNEPIFLLSPPTVNRLVANNIIDLLTLSINKKALCEEFPNFPFSLSPPSKIWFSFQFPLPRKLDVTRSMQRRLSRKRILLFLDYTIRTYLTFILSRTKARLPRPRTIVCPAKGSFQSSFTKPKAYLNQRVAS